MRRYGKLHRLGIGNLHYIRYLLLPHINDASAFHVPTCTDLLGVTTYIRYLTCQNTSILHILYYTVMIIIISAASAKVLVSKVGQLTYRYLYIRQ